MEKRILFVDDEPIIGRTLAIIAEQHGYRCRSASSGQEALNAIREFTPDILVTDYSMPGLNGFELATLVSRECPGCRLFLLTAYSDSDSFRRPPRAPNVAVISKPVPPAKLLQILAHPDEGVDAAEKCTILNVDDHTAHRYSITRLLTHRGFSVVEAASGAEALAKLAENTYNAVLLDINMPDMDGFEVCRRIRQDLGYRKLPVVHFTATYNDPAAEEHSKRVEADEFVTQPVEPDELVAKIRSLMQQSITEP